MAMQMACTLRGLSSPLLRESNGEISSSRSAIPVMSLCSPLIKNGISSSSSCQLLQSSRIFILQATCPRIQERRGVLVGVRCEQSTEGNNSLDIWLGRIAMLSFVAAITIEITTGKGVLQMFYGRPCQGRDKIWRQTLITGWSCHKCLPNLDLTGFLPETLQSIRVP